MIKAVIFDFDGVVVESAAIKTDAFRKLFEEKYPKKVNEIIQYHISNMGISRFVKFRHIYENILKLPLSTDEEEMLGNKFSEVVFSEVIKAPFVKGAREFFERNQNRFMMFIVSGTPDEELKDILKRRNISNYFKETHGTPARKPQVINGILEKYSLCEEEVVFVGDAETDLRAAEETGVYFIARLSHNNNQNIGDCTRKISDLTELESAIDTVYTE